VLIALGVIAPSPAFPVALFGTVAWSAAAAVTAFARANRAPAPATLGSASA
jgi:hypothetical protein